MSRIHYDSNEGMLVTECPHGQTTRIGEKAIPRIVGTFHCKECEYFKQKDVKRHIVVCTFKNKNKDNMNKVKQIIANIIGKGMETLRYEDTLPAEPYPMQATEDGHNLGSVRHIEDSAEQLHAQDEAHVADLSHEYRRLAVRLGVRIECVTIGTKLTEYIKAKGYENIRIVGGLGKDASHVGILLSDHPTRFFSPMLTSKDGKRKFMNPHIVDEVKLAATSPALESSCTHSTKRPQT